MVAQSPKLPLPVFWESSQRSASWRTFQRRVTRIADGLGGEAGRLRGHGRRGLRRRLGGRPGGRALVDVAAAVGGPHLEPVGHAVGEAGDGVAARGGAARHGGPGAPGPILDAEVLHLGAVLPAVGGAAAGFPVEPDLSVAGGGGQRRTARRVGRRGEGFEGHAGDFRGAAAAVRIRLPRCGPCSRSAT